MTKPAELYACVYAREFPAQALLRLRPELQDKPCVVTAGKPPLQQASSLNRKARALGIVHGMTPVEVDMFPSAILLARSEREEVATKSILLECAGGFSPRVEDRSEDGTKSMVLYYLESHDLRQLESDSFTLRRQKNSQDSVIVSNAEAIPEDLRKFELRIEGPLLQRIKEALPDALKLDLASTVRSSEPSNTAIKRFVANGGTVEGAQVKRLYNLRVA